MLFEILENIDERDVNHPDEDMSKCKVLNSDYVLEIYSTHQKGKSYIVYNNPDFQDTMLIAVKEDYDDLISRIGVKKVYR